MLDKIVEKKALDTKSRIAVVCAGFALMLLGVNTSVWFLNWLAGAQMNMSDMLLQFWYVPTFREVFFFSVIAAPLWEELAFRVIPIKLGYKIDRLVGGGALWLIVALTTLIFGWGHGQGTVSLMLQGYMGLIMALVYMKTGDHYWSSVSVHALWNLFVLTVYS